MIPSTMQVNSVQPVPASTIGMAPKADAAAKTSNLECLSLYELLHWSLKTHSDESLWTEFIHRSQPIIAGTIIKIMRRWRKPSPVLIDDLVQEVYLKLCANNFKVLRQFVCLHEDALYGFLKVVAANTVQDHFRSARSQKRGNGRQDEHLDPSTMIAVKPSGTFQAEEMCIFAGQSHGSRELDCL